MYYLLGLAAERYEGRGMTANSGENAALCLPDMNAVMLCFLIIIKSPANKAEGGGI